MRFASLFAGVGGFDLAFERAGMDCVGQVEIDRNCRQVLAKHWPDVPRWEDIHGVTGADMGPVDLLCGGFPCQDYSVAGLRGGLAGDRGALWWQFHRLVAECRPEWVVGENVPGLLSSNDGKDFGTIVGSLVELGYGVVWRVLDAQYFGVAQRRRRLFIVGHIGGVPRPEILSLAEGCAWDSPPRRTPGERSASTLAGRTRGGGGLGTDFDLDEGLIAFDEQGGSENWVEADVYNPLGQGSRHLSQLVGFSPDVASTLQTVIRGVPSVEQSDGQLVVQSHRHLGVQGDEVGVVGVVLNGGAEHPRDEAQLVGGEGHSESFRLTDDDLTKPAFNVKAFVQNTRDEVRDLGPIAGALAAQPGMKQQTYLASPQVRRLTPLECERLQGFPDDWTAGQADTQRYRQMGNAVAVPVAGWLGRRLVTS